MGSACVLNDRAQVEARLVSAYYRESFLAACFLPKEWRLEVCTVHQLDDEAVRVGVGARLGFDICIPHQCQCGSPVDDPGLHSFVCRKALGRCARHHALNNLVARRFTSAGTPVTKERTGMFCADGKRSDSLTLV